MKNLNKFIFTAITLFILTPSVVFAAWWNPLTWGIFSGGPKTAQPSGQTKPVKPVKQTPSSSQITKPIIVAPTEKKTDNTIGKTKSSPLVELTNPQIIKKIKPAVVHIKTENGSGSGMIISGGYILTNAHVVSGVSAVDVSTSDKVTLYGTVLGRDENADLAVIKLNTAKILPTVEFGNSNTTEQGDEVFAFGFPFGIEGDVSFKEGTISRRIDEYFETSAEIHPGNSGGPLVNKYGKVIGINTAIFGKTISGIQLGETIKLAIPSNIATNLIAQLKAGRNVVVEQKQEESTAKSLTATQYTAKQSACRTESEQYYNKLVAIAEQVYNDPNLENLITEIEQKIESVKSDADSQIAEITAMYDNNIAQTKELNERIYGAKKATVNRTGGSRYTPELSNGVLADETNQGDARVASYEAEKKYRVSQIRSNTETTVQKYEALIAKGRNDQETRKKDGLAKANDEKSRAYNECME